MVIFHILVYGSYHFYDDSYNLFNLSFQYKTLRFSRRFQTAAVNICVYVYIYIVKNIYCDICIYFYSMHLLKDKITTSKQTYILGFNGYYLISPQRYIVPETAIYRQRFINCCNHFGKLFESIY